MSLRKPGSKKSGGASEKVLELLKANNGIMPYNYKSDAELIKEIFGLSKKEFKRSLTALQEMNKITVIFLPVFFILKWYVNMHKDSFFTG